MRGAVRKGGPYRDPEYYDLPTNAGGIFTQPLQSFDRKVERLKVEELIALRACLRRVGVPA